MVNSGLCRVDSPSLRKVAVDLVDTLEAAHGEALQIQLGRHPQVEVEVERVVVGDERPGGGAAGNELHHGGLHLHEAAPVEEAADVAHHPGAGLEHPARVRVHDQIEIALPILGLLIGQPVVLLRQAAAGPWRAARSAGLHGQLALVGAHQRAAHADDVADVPELLERRVGVVTDVVAAHVTLNLAAAVLQGDEAGLAHDPAQHDAPGHRRPACSASSAALSRPAQRSCSSAAMASRRKSFG
jgi:hypothetical protein